MCCICCPCCACWPCCICIWFSDANLKFDDPSRIRLIFTACDPETGGTSTVNCSFIEPVELPFRFPRRPCSLLPAVPPVAPPVLAWMPPVGLVPEPVVRSFALPLVEDEPPIRSPAV